MNDIKNDMGGTTDDKGSTASTAVTASLRVSRETLELVREVRRFLGERLGAYGTAALPAGAALNPVDGVSMGDVVTLGVGMLREHLVALGGKR